MKPAESAGAHLLAYEMYNCKSSFEERTSTLSQYVQHGPKIISKKILR